MLTTTLNKQINILEDSSSSFYWTLMYHDETIDENGKYVDGAAMTLSEIMSNRAAYLEALQVQICDNKKNFNGITIPSFDSDFATSVDSIWENTIFTSIEIPAMASELMDTILLNMPEHGHFTGIYYELDGDGAKTGFLTCPIDSSINMPWSNTY